MAAIPQYRMTAARATSYRRPSCTAHKSAGAQLSTTLFIVRWT